MRNVKVAVFRDQWPRLERTVNSFIKDKEVIDIKYATPFNINGNTKAGFNFDIYDSIMIVYKEIEDEKVEEKV